MSNWAPCLQGIGGLEIPMEPLEEDVDKTPSEQPVSSEANLDEVKKLA